MGTDSAALDFELGEDLLAVRDLTEEIFTDLATVDRVREVEAEHAGHDARLWATLASSGVLGIPLPEEAGGAGLGMLGLVTLLEQQGRRVAPIRLGDVLAGAALPLATCGTQTQRERWLEPLLAGDLVVTGAWDVDALGEVVRASAVSGEEGPVVSGRFSTVPAAAVAAAVLVPLVLPGGRHATAVVPTDRAGVQITPEAVTDRGSSATLELDGVQITTDELLDVDGDQVAGWTLTRLRIAQAAVALGVCEEAVAITASYTSQREQFGRPLSTNQGVSLRAADAYLDTDAIRLTTLRAAWLLDHGREPEAEAATLVAAWWAKKGGLRVVHATQHLHGGIGADVDYPIHRYFLWGRQAAFALGSAAAVLAELGDRLPTAPRIGAPA